MAKTSDPRRSSARRPGTSGASRRGRAAGERAETKALHEILDDLEARAEGMSERMLARYQQTIPSYRSLPEQTLQQVRRLNMINLRGFIDAMRAGRGPGDDEVGFIRDSATKRAREGVPLSALLAAYRLGAQLAWEEAREIIGTADAARLAAGIELATALMAWVDEVSGAVAQAYLEEYERISSDREAARRDFIDGLIGGELTSDEIRARSEALGLDPDAPAAVAVIAVEHGEDGAASRPAQHQMRAMLAELTSVARLVEAMRGTEIVLLFEGDDATATQLAAELRPLLDRASGVSQVSVRAGVGRSRDSLADVAGSYREASIALSAARAGASAPAALYGEVVVEELILRERGVSRRLAQILDPLDEHPDLKQTLIEFIEHGPSLPTVARRLFLHPNTVAYRLARVRELTGRDPKTPAGVSELFLALRATQLVGE